MERRESPTVTPEMVAMIRQRLAEGVAQHHIAAEFKINQGRVSEIKTGRRFAQVGMNESSIE